VLGIIYFYLGNYNRVWEILVVGKIVRKIIDALHVAVLPVCAADWRGQ